MHRILSPRPADCRLTQRADRAFLRRHLWLPLLGALVIGSVLARGGDVWMADHLFAAEGHRWQLRDSWSTSVLMHAGGKWLSVTAMLVSVGACIHAWRNDTDRRRRWALLYLLLAIALGTGSVSILKTLTHMDCPWDLLRYGGDRPFVGLLQLRPATLPAAACFPAGQASAGYAWVSLYFCALLCRPGWRWRGLAAGIAAGATLGAAQQLRGAHFMSHDVATLAVCWLVSLGLYLRVDAHLRSTSPVAPVSCR